MANGVPLTQSLDYRDNSLVQILPTEVWDGTVLRCLVAADRSQFQSTLDATAAARTRGSHYRWARRSSQCLE
jgi:hypothetical protein